MNLTTPSTRRMLLSNGLVAISAVENTGEKASVALVGTLLSNMAYFGFVPSATALHALRNLSTAQLTAFWADYEPAFQAETGDDRQMDKFVVYKNFPKEVLDMSEAEYWLKQVLMYMGLPNVLFTEEEKARPALFENVKLKVLDLAGDNAQEVIYANLLKTTNRWSDNQTLWAKLLEREVDQVVDFDAVGYKENGVVLVVQKLATDKTNYRIHNATDILRLIAVLSGGDVSLREKVRFKKFRRAERLRFLTMLENCKNLEEDFGMRPEAWKRLLSFLHPSDFRSRLPRVVEAYDKLYNGTYQTFNRVVDAQVKTPDMLDALKSRPGEFVRRFHAAYTLFGTKAVVEFVSIVPKLTTLQLVKFQSYIETIGDRTTLMYAPRGNWARAQVALNEKTPIGVADKKALLSAISKELKARHKLAFPKGVKLDPATSRIKLQTNDQKLAEYGRGTEFDLPENVKFIRSASYWENKSNNNSWFDNGWNFFGEKWQSMGVCAWNSNHGTSGAVFSGDPTNSKDMKGRACQMIDLDLEKLARSGVRFAVWSILCYSRIKFSDANDVLATLQMGEDAISGKLYEPSRAQMVFPLKSEALTSYVAYIDIKERKLVYMDANFGGDVSTASNNGTILTAKMNAYVDYLKSLPSVEDVFASANKGTTPILYTDANTKISSGKAYVFRPENAENTYERIALADIV